MKSWTEWEFIRRQVAIGGQVMSPRSTPLAGVMVHIINGPGPFKRQVSQTPSPEIPEDRDIIKNQQGHAETGLDGIYYFLNLPKGKYTLSVTDPRSGKQNEKNISVSMDKGNNIKMAPADFKLPA